MNEEKNNNHYLNLWDSTSNFIVFLIVASITVGVLKLLMEFSGAQPNDIVIRFLSELPGEILEALFNLSLLFTPYFIFIDFFRKLPFWKSIFLYLLLAIMSILLETLADFVFPVLNLDYQPIDFVNKKIFILCTIGDIFFYFIVMLFFGYIDFLNLKKAKLFKQFLKEKSKATQEEANRVKIELHALQAQINPHFLFNTLNSISTLISTAPEQAKKLLSSMAVLYRKILGASNKHFWDVKDELELVETYLNIESIRLGERLTYIIECLEDVKKITIPSLLIHPLVENAVKHGIAPYVHGGEIKIMIVLKDVLIISVTDKRFVDEAPYRHQQGLNAGLLNITKRLNIHYGEKACFDFSCDENGATAIIKINFSSMDN